MLITPNHFLSVSYHKTNSRQCRDHFKSNVLETALFGRLGVPVTKQRSWVWIPLKPVWINYSIIRGKVHLSAKSDLVYFTACFLRPYLLRAGKHLVNALDLKHKKIIQQLKQLQEKTNICVTFRTWSNFFSRNQCLHAFLQERSQKYFQNELLESIRQTISLACSVLRGRAQKDVFVAAITCSSEKKV